MEKQIMIGQFLQTARKNKNIKLEDVAKKTKININILKSLESNDLAKLPNKTYVKGFVKNYSSTIGIDQKEAMSILETTYRVQSGETEEVEEQPIHLGSLQSDNLEEVESEEMRETLISIIQPLLNKKILISITVIAVVGLMLKGIVTFFSNLSYEQKVIKSTSVNPLKLKDEKKNILEMDTHKKLRDESSTEDNKEEDTTTAAEEAPEAQIEPVKVAKEELEKPEPEVKEEPKKAEEKEEEKKVTTRTDGKFPFKKFYPAPIDMYDVSKDAKETQNPKLLPANIKAAANDELESVYLVAKEEDTWISYQVDDQPVKRYVLRQGRRLFLQGKKILLFMGNFNAATVFWNNQLVSANTRSGVKSLIFPESAAKDHELPLFPSYKGIPYSAEEYKKNMAEAEE